jgi:hypothetical protein
MDFEILRTQISLSAVWTVDGGDVREERVHHGGSGFPVSIHAAPAKRSDEKCSGI